MKSDRVADRVKGLKGSGIREFFDIAQQMEGAISLGVGEPDFVTPWSIREACIFSLEKGYTSYTSNWGMLELREMVSDKIYKDDSVYYEPEGEILITTGVSEAFDLALRALVNPGDEVVLHEPSYVSYKPCTVFAAGTPVCVDTEVKDEFKLRAEKLEEKITEHTKAVILSYPNNPTGATLSRKDLEEIADVVIEHDLLVISDEVYGKLTYEGRHTCFSSLNGMKDRTILLNGFSKAYAMTGWRLGYAAGNKEIIEAMMKIHQYIMLCAPITAQMAAMEALRTNDEVERMVSEYNRRRRLMVEGLREIGLSCFEPKGAFYTFPSIENTGLSSEEFAKRLLLEEKVVVIPGSVFGASGEGFIRCSYAVSQYEIKKALERMGKFLERHRGKKWDYH
ncbi:MAG: aminotransferase class I/II-fold pyridoxal phosphate-dependent enzyme [Methanophagales archaeon]|nr:aminotransferase class I/II-fold pyridoxal phosphate-dependent enzyme [Methanophagales archaeon]